MSWTQLTCLLRSAYLAKQEERLEASSYSRRLLVLINNMIIRRGANDLTLFGS